MVDEASAAGATGVVVVGAVAALGASVADGELDRGAAGVVVVVGEAAPVDVGAISWAGLLSRAWRKTWFEAS